MDALIQDLRYAVRQLAKNPGFAAAVILTLTLGVGANTAVFSLVNWLAFRPLSGVRAPGELAVIEMRRNGTNYRGPVGISFINYADLAASAPAFRGLAAEFRTSVAAAFDGRSSRKLILGFVSGNYFGVLGTFAQRGRILEGDDATSVTSLIPVVISDAMWGEVFGRDPAVVGKTMQLGGKPATIIGITDQRFVGTRLLEKTDAWVPYQALNPLLSLPPRFLEGRRYYGIGPEVFGRLASGASIEAAGTQVKTVLAQLGEAFPADNDNLKVLTSKVAGGVGVSPAARERAAGTLRLLLGIAGILGLIAAANVANLLLFQSVRRRGELAVRRALGASTARLARQRAIDVTLLALLAAFASVLASVWLVTAFRGLAIGGLPALGRIEFDGRVLLFAIAASVLISVIGAVLAPLADRGAALADALKGASFRGSARHGRVRQGLATVQLGASLSLLVGALLLVRTLRNLQSVDLGFDAQRVAAFTLGGRAGGYTQDQYRTFIVGVTDRLKHLPGVEGAGFDDMAPFAGLSLGHSIRRPSDPAPSVSVTVTWMSPEYFATLGIPLKAGRTFRDDELFHEPGASGNPVVVSETLGRRLYGEANPLGLSFGMMGNGVEQQFTVIGVARDARWQEIVGTDAVGPLLYLPFGTGAMGRSEYATLLVRSTLPILRLKQLIEDAVKDLAPAVPVSEGGYLRDRVESTLAEQRLFARTVSLLTALAMALAALGLYGLVAFSVAERTREFGIRIALGAELKAILDLVVRQAAGIMTGGVALGLIGAVVLSRLIASRLFGVTALEPFVYVLAITLLVLVALVASIIPARAATRVDPMVALRSD